MSKKGIIRETAKSEIRATLAAISPLPAFTTRFLRHTLSIIPRGLIQSKCKANITNVPKDFAERCYVCFVLILIVLVDHLAGCDGWDFKEEESQAKERTEGRQSQRGQDLDQPSPSEPRGRAQHLCRRRQLEKEIQISWCRTRTTSKEKVEKFEYPLNVVRSHHQLIQEGREYAEGQSRRSERPAFSRVSSRGKSSCLSQAYRTQTLTLIFSCNRPKICSLQQQIQLSRSSRRGL